MVEYVQSIGTISVKSFTDGNSLWGSVRLLHGLGRRSGTAPASVRAWERHSPSRGLLYNPFMVEERANDVSRARQNDAEQQRLLITLGIIAAAIGTYAIPNSKHTGWLIVRGAITVQAVLAFLYIIATASALKFKGSGSLFDIRIPEKARQWFYDLSIEMFWATIYAGVMSVLFAKTSTKTMLFWSLGVLAVGVFIILVVVVLMRRRKRPLS